MISQDTVICLSSIYHGTEAHHTPAGQDGFMCSSCVQDLDRANLKIDPAALLASHLVFVGRHLARRMYLVAQSSSHVLFIHHMSRVLAV